MSDSLKHFSKVREAREALQAKALELFELQVQLIKEAMAAQDFETAQKALAHLTEHMPKDTDGTSYLDPSIDQKKQIEGPKGPQIQIGIALGGMNHKALPETTIIDVTPDEAET